MPGPLLPLLAAALLAASTAAAAGPLPPPLTLQLTPLDGLLRSSAGADATLDLGTVAARGGPGRSSGIVLRQRVAVRLEGRAASARLWVSLGADWPGVIIRVDGQALSLQPRLLDAAHRVGATVVHQIEILVPPQVAPGPFLNNLHWLAETD